MLKRKLALGGGAKGLLPAALKSPSYTIPRARESALGCRKLPGLPDQIPITPYTPFFSFLFFKKKKEKREVTRAVFCIPIHINSLRAQRVKKVMTLQKIYLGTGYLISASKCIYDFFFILGA
jgi:hypothetical protein